MTATSEVDVVLLSFLLTWELVIFPHGGIEQLTRDAGLKPTSTPNYSTHRILQYVPAYKADGSWSVVLLVDA